MKNPFNKNKSGDSKPEVSQGMPPLSLKATPKVSAISKKGKYALTAAAAAMIVAFSVSPILKKINNEKAAAEAAKEEISEFSVESQGNVSVNQRTGEISLSFLGNSNEGLLLEPPKPVVAPSLVVETPAETEDSAPKLVLPAVPDLTGRGGQTPIEGLGASAVGVDGVSEAEKALQEARLQKQIAAYSAAPTVGFDTQGRTSQDRSAIGSGAPQTQDPYQAMISQYLQQANSSNGLSSEESAMLQSLVAGGGVGGDSDLNKQASKAGFLAAASQSTDPYLEEAVIENVSPYELKAGSVVTGVMVTGLNSDLPGQVIGQVREDVYDSITGANLVIPKGTKLLGRYDSRVAFGQERALMAWDRMIFPNGHSINLRGMQGSDNQGYSGFADQVDNHYWKLIKGAFVLSTFAYANIQILPSEGDADSPQGAAAAEFAGTFADFGAQLGGRMVQVQPTIKIRPGYTFSIMINKDMVFPSAYPFK